MCAHVCVWGGSSQFRDRKKEKLNRRFQQGVESEEGHGSQTRHKAKQELVEFVCKLKGLLSIWAHFKFTVQT